MKKKKLDGLSLKKNMISKLGSSKVKGGIIVLVTEGCVTYGDCTRNCIVLTGGCGLTEVNCDSIHIACN